MNIEDVRNYCLSKPYTWEDLPFDQDTLVFKVDTKMFALMNMSRLPLSVNLKCDPEYALELRDTYEAVSGGYHMSKKHWNTILLEGDVDSKKLAELVDHSYDLIYQSLTKKRRVELESQI